MKFATKVGLWTKILLVSLLLALILAGCSTEAEKEFMLSESGDQGSVVLYYFWGDGCPHCAAAKPWLAEMDSRYPELAIRAFEVWHVEANQDLYLQMADAFAMPNNMRGVPVFYLADQFWVGYGEGRGDEIEAAVQSCIESRTCGDAGAGVIPGAMTGLPQNEPGEEGNRYPSGMSITIPFLGSIDLSRQSLVVSTLLISFIDGFNPCSLWVLSMLLALTLHTGSRKKVMLIGFIFISVTAFVYALFIAGLFTFLTIISFVWWIQVLVALIALTFAVVNIKDYFWYKEGISFTISDQHKPGIFQRIRRVMDTSQSFGGLVGATVVMAAGVSLVEFSCTAGFPVVWTNLLTSQNVTYGTFLGLLLLYMIVYQLDELFIFGTAVLSLKASRLEEKQGRILKLIGGVLMLALALVMLVNPAFMNTLSGTLVVFAVAFIVVVLILVVHRKILPSFGIWIGTETEGQQKAKERAAQE
jgi:thiol-disulfide isomerase/thioredoxin